MNKQVSMSFRITKEDADNIKEKAKIYNKTLTEYIIESCINQSFVGNLKEDILPVLIRVNNVLNQRIATYPEKAHKELIEGIDELWQLLK